METATELLTIGNIFKFLFAAFFIYAGIAHFRHPKFFLKITPPWVPEPDKVNIFVGVVEVILGIALLIPQTQSYAAWGIIALLIAVFPANVYHHQKARKKGKMVWQTMLRLPIQGLLIYWAYLYT
ncbi:MAG: MauE/DoxX family redox-associated membrane protein [Bacteroidota bacterium]